MNIVVLIKSVPKRQNDVYNENFTIKRSGCGSELNHNDFFAVEEALRLRERYGGTVTALSMGGKQAEKQLRYVVSMGVDEGVLISDSVFGGSDTYATAYILSSVLKEMNCSLIVCGRKTSDGSTAQVPVEIAAMLNIDFASLVCKCSYVDGMFECTEKHTDKLIGRQLKLPALISVAEDINTPRLPSLEGIVRGQKSRIRIISNSELKLDKNKCGINGSLTRVVGTSTNIIADNRQGIVLTDKSEMMIDFSSSLRLNSDSETSKSKANDITVDLTEYETTNILVFCEITDGEICSESLDVIHRAAVVADELKTGIAVITTNGNDMEIRECLCNLGIKREYRLDIDNVFEYDTAYVCDEVIEILDAAQPKILLMASTSLGMIYAPYIAAKTHSGLTADCIDLSIENGKFCQERPAFGGDINAKIVSTESKYAMSTLKPFVSERIAVNVVRCETETVMCGTKKYYGKVNKLTNRKNVSFDNKVIFGIGNGVNRRAVEKLKAYCDMNNYGLCATRSSVDSGIIGYEYQVGLTGKTISPQLYVAIGVSGAREHMIGVRGCETIISVNTDVSDQLRKKNDRIYKIDAEEFINAITEK